MKQVQTKYSESNKKKTKDKSKGHCLAVKIHESGTKSSNRRYQCDLAIPMTTKNMLLYSPLGRFSHACSYLPTHAAFLPSLTITAYE